MPEFDLTQIYNLKDLKKLKKAGASAQVIQQAHALLPENKKRRKKATKKLLNLSWSHILSAKHQIKKLAKQGANLNVKDANGYTMLHQACMVIPCSAKKIKFLVKCGVNVNVKDKKGNTPLHWLCGTGQIKMVRFLVEHGADIHATNIYGETLLHKACGFGHMETVEFLLEQGADIHALTKYGELPLHKACEGTNVDLVKLLVAEGFGVNVENASGNTPLHYASMHDTGMVEVLTAYGADIHSSNITGRTPLHIASAQGCSRAVKHFVKCGADVNASDICGRTPVHKSMFSYPVLAGYLVRHGANPQIRDIGGQNAFDVAPDYDSKIILENACKVREEETGTRKICSGQSRLSVFMDRVLNYRIF